MGIPVVGDWLDMMPDTVTVAAFVSRSVSGVITWDDAHAVSYRCYIEMKNHLTVDKSGRTVTARGKVFLATATLPNTEDKLTLPGNFQPTNPPILAVNSVSDETGTHHVTLEIG